MATLQELQARLEALRAKRARAERSVSYDGTTVEYKSDAEMAAAIVDLERQISAETGTPIRRVTFSSSKGL